MASKLKYQAKGNDIIIKELKDFDISHIIECGQCFRWEKEKDNSYTIQAFSKAINVSQSGEEVIISNSDLKEFEEIWIDYFDLNRDYGRIKNLLTENDPIMAQAIAYGQGMRLLNQDEWETLVSFLISQNSNIPRIKGAIKAVSESFGKPYMGLNGRTFYTFPNPSEIYQCRDEDIDACRLGYRKSYVTETAKEINKDNAQRLYNLKNEKYTSAYDYLLSLKGVGPKVANCVMLFSMEKYESFPIDVWVKRIMSRLYGQDENDLKGMEQFAKEKFGDLGGFAQQYLFYYVRENHIL
jgi:N-glycosylase/DNA lyase